MVIGVFEPTTAAWTALFLFVGLGAVAGLQLASTASAFHWKLWMRRHRLRPWGMYPRLFASCRFTTGILFGVAVWLFWNEAHKVENGLANIHIGATPDEVATDVYVFWTLLTALVSWTLYLISPQVFFIGGVDSGLMGVAFFNEFLAWAGVTALAVLFYLVWWVPGLLMTFVWINITYTVYVIGFYWNQDPQLICVSPVEHIAVKSCPGEYGRIGRQHAPHHHQGQHHAQPMYASHQQQGAPLLTPPGVYVGQPGGWSGQN